jgi:hypothetical protein
LGSLPQKLQHYPSLRPPRPPYQLPDGQSAATEPDKRNNDGHVVCRNNHSAVDYRGSNVCRNTRWPLCYENKGGMWTRHEKTRACLRFTCSTHIAPLLHYIVKNQNSLFNKPGRVGPNVERQRFLRDSSTFLPDYTPSQPRRQ